MGFTELATLTHAPNTVGSLPSCTPTANALVILFTLKWNGNSANPSQETVDGTAIGCTFELVGTPVVVEPGGTARGLLSMWVAQPASPATGQMTIDFRANSGGGGIAWLGQDTKVPLGDNGARAIVQTNTDAEDSGGVAYEHGAEDTGAPLAAFGNARNKTLVCLVLRGTATYTTTIDFEAGITEFTNLVLNDDIDWVMRVGWRSGANVSPAASWPDSAAAAASIAAEIAQFDPTDYSRSALLETIAFNLDATIDEALTDYSELRSLRAIVTAEGGTPTPVAGTYERRTLLNDWATAIGAGAAGTTDYAEVEALRVIAADYGAADGGGSNYEPIRLLTAIATATEPA